MYLHITERDVAIESYTVTGTFHRNLYNLKHVAFLRELASQKRQPLLGNDSAETSVSRKSINSRHMIAAKDIHATIKFLEVVFFVWSVPRLYNEDQPPRH
jgi:hypothetical protein